MKVLLVLALLLLQVRSDAQLKFENAGFELKGKSSSAGAAGWQRGGTLDTAYADSQEHYQGKASMKIRRSQATGEGVVYQEVAFTNKGLTKFRVSCAIKARDLKGTTGIGVRLFDKAGNTITGYHAAAITADQDWAIISGEFYCDDAVSKAKLFCNITGSGTVWFDQIAVLETGLDDTISPAAARQFINQYFYFVNKYSVVRDSQYLNLLKANTLKLCAGHHDIAYWENILKRYTTLKLNDGHSFMFTAAEWKDYQKGSEEVTTSGLVNYASGRMAGDGIAYISVPTFASLDKDIIHQYVDSLQAIIRQLDGHRPRGWIIDLSENQGGNSFAMLPGLGPLLGNGVCGYSASADGSKRTRVYQDGYAGWHPDTSFMQRTPVYKAMRDDLPIAVVYGNGTASSGEVVAISFRGKSNTRSFGQQTAGATTRVDNLELFNGASLNLACGWDMDRNGQIYRSGVTPDVVTASREEAIKKASDWILHYKK